MPANKSAWKSGRANSWWCIAYHGGLMLPWTAARTRCGAWVSWSSWYVNDTPETRARFKAVRILVTEVPDAD